MGTQKHAIEGEDQDGDKGLLMLGGGLLVLSHSPKGDKRKSNSMKKRVVYSPKEKPEEAVARGRAKAKARVLELIRTGGKGGK